MKRFVITEEEQIRIKNLYEQLPGMFKVENNETKTLAKSIGFSEPSRKKECYEVMILDGSMNSNINCALCDNGYFEIKNTGMSGPAKTTGGWTSNNSKIEITLSDGKVISGPVSDGSLQSQIAQYIIDNRKNFKGGYIGDEEIDSLKGYVSGGSNQNGEQSNGTEEKKSSPDNKVAQIQQKVIDAGLGDKLGPKGKDGKFGPYTADAVLQLLNKK